LIREGGSDLGNDMEVASLWDSIGLRPMRVRPLCVEPNPPAESPYRPENPRVGQTTRQTSV
jgi:hypothetical protein